MDSVTGWILQVCICAVAVAIAENILPGGNVKKSVYFVMGLIVIMCIASPIKNFSLSDIDINMEKQEMNGNTDWFNRITEDEFKRSVTELIAAELDEMKISQYEIEIFTDIDEDNCIFISRVRITISSADSFRIDEICDTLHKDLGIDADVVVG